MKTVKRQGSHIMTKLANSTLQEVESFKYLGSTLANDGN